MRNFAMPLVILGCPSCGEPPVFERVSRYRGFFVCQNPRCELHIRTKYFRRRDAAAIAWNAQLEETRRKFSAR